VTVSLNHYAFVAKSKYITQKEAPINILITSKVKELGARKQRQVKNTPD